MWIDALAINQTDIAERNAQVSKMRTMYSLAESTVIWLGPMDDDPKDEVMSSAVNLAMVYSLVAPEAYNEMIADLDEDRPLFTLTMLETLRNCPYWNRVWVVQEIMFSRCIWLVYGTDIAPYPDMESFYNSTSVALEERYRKSQLPPVYLALAVLLHGKAVGIPKCGAAHRQEYLTLNRWMRGVDTKGATEPRDIVFAFAGCFEPKTRDLIEVDYSRGLGEVLVDMTLLLINDATSLDPILMGEGVLEQEPAVPSWLWIPKSIAFRQKDQHKRHRNGFSWSLERTGRPAGVLPFVADYDAKEKTLRVKGKLCFVVRSKATPFIPQDFDPLASSDEVLAKHLKLFSILVQPTLNALKLRPESPQLEELLPEKSNFKLWHTMSTQLALEDPHWESIRDRLAGYRLFCDFLALRSVFICTQSLPVQGESHDRPGKEETIYGFGPMNMAPGDYICAIRGCSLPLILRQVGQYYRIIGSAKVPAIMRGETVKADEDGEEEAEDFFLK